MILAFISAFLIGVSKAISDMVQHKDIWDLSIFSKFDKESFFGSKDYTWIRKHKYKNTNKFLYWLFKNPLVMFTDIWHLGNTIRICSTWSLLVGFIEMSDFENWILYLLLIPCILLYMFGFSLFYKVILRKDKDDKEVK